MELLRSEGRWGEAGPTGLSRPEQVGLLIWLTAALPIRWAPPPPHTLIPVSEHVWKGSYAVTGNWPCFLCLYLTAE